jgi:PKD repeat protein
VTYAWSLSGGGTITSPLDGNTASVNWGNTPGTYTLTLTETRLGCETVNELVVEVKETVADFNFAVGSADGLTINFTDASTGNASVWFWTFGDNTSSGNQNPSHTYASAGTYTVCLEVTGDCGTDTYCQDIVVTFNPTTVCDDIVLNAGLNLISTDVIPVNSSITSVFASLINSNNLLFIQGRNSVGGVVIFDPSLPPFLNTLTQINPGEGYYVRVASPATLTVCGTPIDPAFKKNLNSGINLVAYVPQVSSTPSIYFSQLLANNNLLFARGFNNGFKIFDPALPPFLNTLTSVDNGFGYEIRVVSAVLGTNWLVGNDDEVDYRGEEATVSKSINYDVIAATSNLPASAEGKNAYLVTESGEILGRMNVLAGGYLFTTPVYGFDASVEGSSNLRVGDKILFKFEDRIVDAGLIFYGDKRINLVEVNFPEYALVTEGKILKDFEVYPNPFSSNLNLVFDINTNGRVAIHLLNILGQRVEVLLQDGELSAGRYEFRWEGKHLDAGTYFVQLLIDGKPTAVRPVIRQE